MKKILILVLGAFYMLSCSTDANDTPYEPIFLNETEINVSIMYGHVDELSGYANSIAVSPGDSAYCTSGEYFPLLDKDGLTGMNSKLYDVKLVFYPNTDSSKCLAFEGDDFRQNDIRKFSSYENIGRCYFCVIRAMVEPDGMLYRITEDMLKEAIPCE